MAANPTLAAALFIVGSYNKSPVMEEADNYVLTGLGYDAAGNANSAKYVSMTPDYNIPVVAANLTAAECTDPVSMEKVKNIALLANH